MEYTGNLSLYMGLAALFFLLVACLGWELFRVARLKAKQLAFELAVAKQEYGLLLEDLNEKNTTIRTYSELHRDMALRQVELDYPEPVAEEPVEEEPAVLTLITIHHHHAAPSAIPGGSELMRRLAFHN